MTATGRELPIDSRLATGSCEANLGLPSQLGALYLRLSWLFQKLVHMLPEGVGP